MKLVKLYFPYTSISGCLHAHVDESCHSSHSDQSQHRNENGADYSVTVIATTEVTMIPQNFGTALTSTEGGNIGVIETVKPLEERDRVFFKRRFTKLRLVLPRKIETLAPPYELQNPSFLFRNFIISLL